MPSKSSVKGKAGERELAKILAKTFGGSWQRVKGSGAFTGGKNSFRASTLSNTQLLSSSNDIIPPDEFANCAVESKAYEDFDFHLLLRENGNATLNKWISQVHDSGIDIEKNFPMICFKPNRKGWFICVGLRKVSHFDLGKLNFSVYRYKDKAYLITDMLRFFELYKDELILLFR